MKSTRSIRKIKINDKKVVIQYVNHIITDDERLINNAYEVKSEMKPHKDFFNAFQDLKKHAISIGELSLFKGKQEKNFMAQHVVTTLNISENKDSTDVMISVNKYIKSGQCYSITTPITSLENSDYSELSELNQDIDNVISEALQFLKGKNGEQQLTLNFEGDEIIPEKTAVELAS